MEAEDKPENISEVKYCVCAMLDLLGFSSHLEIGAYDLRTNIGQQAIKRLEILETALEIIQAETAKRSNFYPSDIKIQRINDAIFLTLDLDEILIPSIGSTNFKGLSINSMEKFFPKEQRSDMEYDEFSVIYNSRIQNSLNPLQQFIGMIARTHQYINKMENSSHYPGVKTVISTGFRRPFLTGTSQTDDHFSANFALSNVYIAEKSLKGSSFYVENGVIQMLSHNLYSRNTVKFSHFLFKESNFDCFKVKKDVFSSTSLAYIENVYDINLFRKQYSFRKLNPSPLTYLQSLPSIENFLNEKEKPKLSNKYYKHILNAVRIGIEIKTISENNPPPSFIFNGTNDLTVDIGIFHDYLTNGESLIKKELEKQKFEEEHSTITDEGKQKIKESLDETVTIDLPNIDIEENKEFIFTLSEEVFSSLSIAFSGNWESLDYGGDEQPRKKSD